MAPCDAERPVEGRPPAGSHRSRSLLWWGMAGGCGLIVCGLALMAGLTWNRGRIQQRKVQSLERFDASIYADYGPYEYQPPISSAPVAGLTGLPLRLVYGEGQRVLGFSVMDEPAGLVAWLVPLFGEHCFAEVHDVCIFNEEFSDADVPLLLAFPELRKVNVSDSALTDVGVRELLSLPRLAVLNVARIRLSAETLRQMAQCHGLIQLDIGETGADPETIEFLQKALPACHILD